MLSEPQHPKILKLLVCNPIRPPRNAESYEKYFSRFLDCDENLLKTWRKSLWGTVLQSLWKFQVKKDHVKLAKAKKVSMSDDKSVWSLFVSSFRGKRVRVLRWIWWMWWIWWINSGIIILIKYVCICRILLLPPDLFTRYHLRGGNSPGIQENRVQSR